MNKKKGQKVLSVVMSLLMIVGLFPSGFTLFKVEAAVTKVDINLSGGLATGQFYGGSGKVSVLEDMNPKSPASGTTIDGINYPNYVSGTSNPVYDKTTFIPSGGAVLKFEPTENSTVDIACKVNNGKELIFVSENGSEPDRYKNESGSSQYLIKTYELTAGSVYYFYSAGSKVPIYGISVKTGKEDTNIDWSAVQAPVLNTPVAAGNQISVGYNAVIGDLGGEKLTVEMYKENQLVDSKVIKAQSEEGAVTFDVSSSGTYTFKAKLQRTGLDDKESNTVEVNYVLPLATPQFESITSLGNGKVSVTWGAVAEATSYEVRYSEDGTQYSEPIVLDTTTATVTNLKPGTEYTFEIKAKRGNDFSDAARQTATVSEEVQRVWAYSAFGQGISSNKTSYSGNLYEGNLNINASSGKLVPASTDGLAYYYTAISPTQNFTLKAKVKVNSWKFTNGQEGFGIMAADAVGKNGDSSIFWNNSYIAGVSKTEYFYDPETKSVSDAGDKITMKIGVFGQEKKGVPFGTTGSAIPETFSSTQKPLDYSTASMGAGTYNIVGNYSNSSEPTGTVNNLTEFDLTIKRDNTGYRCMYTDPKGNTTTQTFYDYDGTNLTQLDPDNIYVGFFASRNFDISVESFELETIDRIKDAPPEYPDTTYITPTQSIISPSDTGIKDYNLVLSANSDGVVTVKSPDGKIIMDKAPVKAQQYVKAPEVQLNDGENQFEITFDPDDDYIPGEYQKLSSYEPVTFSHTVNYKTIEGENIWIGPDGTSKAEGNKENPLDIYTAVKYVKPGQTIVLKPGTYQLTSPVKVARGIDGTEDKPIRMVADPSSKTRPILDFGKISSGIVFAGNYWYIKGFDVTHTGDAQKGLQLSGSNCTLDQVNAYHNGNTGVQISRLLSTDAFEQWPANNLVLNCSSYGNADKGYEDADGFAAKLTVGEGNVFRGCISHHNADDGWDLFAKPESGPIGKVIIENCIAYSNGILEDGTDAGNGNGFKMGGSSIVGEHELINSIAYDNKAKGIDSNSCPDIKVENAISFNNGGSNVAFYTNDAVNTNFIANGIISFRTEHTDIAENIKLKGTQEANSPLVYNETNYFWMADGKSINTKNVQVTSDWFKSLDTSIAPTRKANGSIDMKGLLELTEKAPATSGARLKDTPSGVIVIAEDRKDTKPGTDDNNSEDITSPIVTQDNNKAAQTPKTGDRNNTGMYGIILTGALCMMTGCIIFRKRRDGMDS